MNKENGKQANHLINETSPYLLQHAYNPVDWYPWGEEALQKAQEEDKLLIISVGYAACHWCHVMEHESFEDSTVARIMNEHFVSIKVDREERPDVDDVYMTAAQLISGRGGWPLNAIAMPDGRPVYAGTYYPKNEWINILEQIVKIKEEQPERLEQTADQLTAGINQASIIEVQEGELEFGMEDLDVFMAKAMEKYDKTYGGRTGTPKFPMPNSYEFLMQYHWLTGSEEAWEITETSLDNMARGGIYDQLGGGFARYSVDAFWLVPHFEKMLYDNAQLVSLYAHAYKVSGKPLYKDVVEQTLRFIEREMTSDENGFYSSLDADSEGEEGKFYVWQASEVDSLLTDETMRQMFKKRYNVSEGGNWEEKNILNVMVSIPSLAEEFSLSEEEVSKQLAAAQKILFDARSKRERPGLDDKILTSWNALMISGYAAAYEALGDENYLDKAREAATFLKKNMMEDDGRLSRNYKDGASSINAFLDDYALLAKAFMDLYQVTFDEQWIEDADLLVRYALEHFYNKDTRMFNYTSDLDPPLIAKKSEYADNVIPSSNSVMANVLHTLGSLKYNSDYIDMSEQMVKNMIAEIRETEFISFYSNWLQALLNFIRSPYEIAIVGPDADEVRKRMSNEYLGHSLILGSEDASVSLDLLKDKYVEGSTIIYVCQNKVCKLPVEEVAAAMDLIEAGN